LRDAGVRIVFRVTNEIVEVLRVVYILTIEKRSNDFVFKLASKRFLKFKTTDISSVLKKSKTWHLSKKNE
jgi:mRNA interferase RelE/StbE